MKSEYFQNINNGGKELSSGFLRQRRNLVLSSLFLIVFILGALTVKEINFVLAKFKVGDEKNLLFVIYTIHLYFFLRYAQYYSNEKSRILWWSVLVDNYINVKIWLLKKIVDKKLSILELKNKEYIFPQYDKNGNFKEDFLVFEPDPDRSKFKNSTGVILQIWGDDEKRLFSGGVGGFNDKYEDSEWVMIENPFLSSGKSGAFIESYVEYSRLWELVFFSVSVFQYLFKQSYFTDYELPFLLGITPVIFLYFGI